MPITVTVEEAQQDFSRLLERLRAGEEEVIIAEGDTPVARLVPAAAKPGRRVPGTAKGLFEVPDDFNEPLPDDILDLFYK